MQFIGSLWRKAKTGISVTISSLEGDYFFLILAVLMAVFLCWQNNSIAIFLFVFSFIYLLFLTRNMFITKDNSTLKRVLGIVGMFLVINFLISPFVLAASVVVIATVVSTLIGIIMSANKKQNESGFIEKG